MESRTRRLSRRMQALFDRPRRRDIVAILRVVDAANHDFPEVVARPPIVQVSRHPTLEAAVRVARAVFDAKTSGRLAPGHDISCDIEVAGGDRAGCYHVSQNGRLWSGASDAWSDDTTEIRMLG